LNGCARRFYYLGFRLSALLGREPFAGDEDLDICFPGGVGGGEVDPVVNHDSEAFVFDEEGVFFLDDVELNTPGLCFFELREKTLIECLFGGVQPRACSFPAVGAHIFI